MKAKNTLNVFIFTVFATITFGMVDLLQNDSIRGDNVFAVLAALSALGCIIAFFTALAAAWKTDCPEPEDDD
jgi:amino acid permease